jgi:hypothetical protein
MNNWIYFRQLTLKKLKIVSFLMLFLTVISACKSKKNLILSSNVPTKNTQISKSNLASIIEHQTQFSTFTTKAITDLNLNGKQYDVTFNIRIKKGEKIWISVTAIAGLEVARALFTPDSIQILDRLNEEYLNKPFSFIHDFSSPHVNYQTLEALLLGNCLPIALTEADVILNPNGWLTLKGRQQNMDYAIQINNQFKTRELLLFDDLQQQKMAVNMSVFEEIAGQFLPSNFNISALSPKKQLKVVMKYNKTELNIPLEFPFNVPKRFSEIH